MSGVPAIKARRSTSSKNEPPILSHRYFVKNHADILCSGLILVCVASMWNKTHPVAIKFLWPNQTADWKVDEYIQYAPCRYDPLLLVTYIIVAISIHSLVKTYLVDRWLRKVKLSWSSSFEANRMIQRAVFETIIICYSLYVWSYVPNTALHMSIDRLLGGTRGDVSFDAYAKFWYVFNLSYWAHWLFEIYFELYPGQLKSSGTARYDEALILATMSSGYLFVCAYAYVTRMWHLGCCLLLTNYSGLLPLHLMRALTLLKVSIAHDVSAVLKVTCIVTLSASTLFNAAVTGVNLSSVARAFLNAPSAVNSAPAVYLMITLLLQLANSIVYWRIWHWKGDDDIDVLVAPKPIVTRSKAKSKKSQ